MSSTRRLSRWLLVSTAIAVGSPSPITAQVADSLVLERTLCYGTCPAYRLSLAAGGRITFESRNPGDSTRGQDVVASATLATLLHRAQAFNFFSLPDRLRDDRALCSDYATDHPTVTLTIFRAGGAKAVEDYHGCFARSDHSVVDVVRALRAFEAAVDSATNAQRWVRPARRR